jgi:hypothetical protein
MKVQEAILRAMARHITCYLAPDNRDCGISDRPCPLFYPDQEQCRSISWSDIAELSDCSAGTNLETNPFLSEDLRIKNDT